jgi:glutathione S-transferase
MALRLHGYSLSGSTLCVAVIAKERNIPYELVSVDLKAGEQKQPTHVEHQPFGQVPYIVVRVSPTQATKILQSFVCSDSVIDE